MNGDRAIIATHLNFWVALEYSGGTGGLPASEKCEAIRPALLFLTKSSGVYLSPILESENGLIRHTGGQAASATRRESCLALHKPLALAAVVPPCRGLPISISALDFFWTRNTQKLAHIRANDASRYK